MIYPDNLPMKLKCHRFLLLFLLSTVAIAAPPQIAIDVGHGLLDSGASSARGRSEFAFNLDFAVVLARNLRESGLAVQEINFSGEIRELAARPMQASGSDFFLSIHHDSISSAFLESWDWDGNEATFTTLKRGFGLFVSARNPDLALSQRCASEMGRQLRLSGFLATPWHGRKHLAADAENGVWYYDNLVVLHRTDLPAVLFEAGVIKHREEELELLDTQRQAHMAQALTTGLARCLNFRERPVPD